MATEVDIHPNYAVNNKVFPIVMIGDPATGQPSTGGTAGSLSDTVFVDSTDQLFAYRDLGTGTPIAYKIPEWTEYTPIAPVKSTDQAVANYSQESGGNLEAIKNKLNTKALNVDLEDTDVGLITNTVIHGRCTSHGGEFVDVKVSHSGAMAVDTSGSAVDALVAAGNATLAEIDARVGRYANLKLYAVDETTAGTTYLMKAGVTAADPWLVMKLVESAGITLATYAGVVNNPSVTTRAGAWSGRTSLTYGDIAGA